MRRLLAVASAHSTRSAALVTLLACCGLRISEALGADVHDYGHRVLRITRKGGHAARVPLAPPVVRALDTYLEARTSESARTGKPLFLAADGVSRYPYKSAYEQLGRLCCTANLPPRVSPHSLRHSYATPTPPKPCA